MLVKFTGTDGNNTKPIWVEVLLVRLVSRTVEASERSDKTVIYQEDSDTPIYVVESDDEVARIVNEGKLKDGAK